MNLSANSSEQLQTLIFLKVFVFTYHSLAVLHLANSNLWKEVRKIISLIARDENQHLAITQNILNKWKQGDDPEMAQIFKEEEQWLIGAFENCVNQEKLWAEYLFKDGSMIGLNDKLLQQYVEWVANRRMKALGLKPIYDIPAKNNPLPGRNIGFLLRVSKLLLRKLRLNRTLSEVSKQDVKKDTFSGFQL